MVGDVVGKTPLPPASPPLGRRPALDRSEVVTLALFGQGAEVPSERACSRDARRRLRALVPTLPDRAQVTRHLRAHREPITAVAQALDRALAVGDERAFAVIDGTGGRTRTANRRGGGRLDGQADIGWCTHVGCRTRAAAGRWRSWRRRPCSTSRSAVSSSRSAGADRRSVLMKGPASACRSFAAVRRAPASNRVPVRGERRRRAGKS